MQVEAAQRLGRLPAYDVRRRSAPASAGPRSSVGDLGLRVGEVDVVQRELAAHLAERRPGRSASGVIVCSRISSAIRPTETRVCCHESKTCDSCWIGEKNIVEVEQERDQDARCVSRPCSIRWAPTPSTITSAIAERNSTNGKYVAISALRADARPS